VRIKQSIFFLITLAFLSACKNESMTATRQPMSKPSVTGLTSVEIDQPSAVLIRQHMGMFLNSNPYTEYAAGSQLLIYLVSSGAFDQAQVTLEGGETYQLDVLYAYALMSTQKVLTAPVLIGMVLPDDTYAYFSKNYSLDVLGSITTTSADRETALVDARARLPRGRIFRLLAYGIATRAALDWNKCPSVPFYPQEICSIGELIEQLNPNQTKTFVLHLADEFPTSWLLVGWFFQEFAPDELVPGTIINVPLQELIQP
jgi:hypothetical protein